MKISDQYRGQYLKATDLSQPRTLTVHGVTIEEMPDGTKALVVQFVEESQKLSINQTNRMTLVDLFGDETDDWLGKRVELFVVDTEYDGRPTKGIRVRKPLSPEKARPTDMVPVVPVPVVPVPVVPVPVVPATKATPTKKPKVRKLPKRGKATPANAEVKAPPIDYSADA